MIPELQKQVDKPLGTNSALTGHLRRWDDQIGNILPYFIAVCIGAVALLLFTRNNDFPVYYHPDEQTKVDQLSAQDQPRNYNHPLLLLEAANLAIHWFHVPLDDGRLVAIAGRWTSAVLATIGVVGLILASFYAYGYTGLLLTGVTMAMCPPLLVYAHYLKEDASLIAGICVSILGARTLVSSSSSRKQLAWALLLGIGCAVSASAKYVGLVVLLPCLFVIGIAPMCTRWIVPVRLFAFLAAASLSVVVINARAFSNFLPPTMTDIVRTKIVAEFHHGMTGQNEVTLEKPNVFWFRVSAHELMLHTWAFLIVGFAIWLFRSRTVTRWGLTLAMFLATLASALSFNAIPIPRHALPITVMGYFLAAQLMAAALLGLKDLHPRVSQAVLSACIGVAVIFQGCRCLSFENQFKDDSRQRLREWVASNLPVGSTIGIDRFVVLDSLGDPWRFPEQSSSQIRVARSRQFLADEGPVAVLKRRGMEYVAIAKPTYERYFTPGAHAVLGQEALFEKRKKFYTELLEHGDLIWSSAPAPESNAYLNPELRLYRCQ